MDEKRSYSQGSLVTGIVLLVIGAFLLLQNLDIIYVGSVWSYWPFILVLIGSVKIVNSWDKKSFGEGVWWIFIGVWLYVSIQHVYGLDFGETWPALVIAWGVSILWKSYDDKSFRKLKEQHYGN